MPALAREIESAYPRPRLMTEWRVQPALLADAKTDPAIRKSLLIMFAAVGFVLLIACVNVANLLLGRAISRQKEVAVRLALGASRRAMIGQFLTESVILGLAGGLAGFFVAVYAIDFAAALRPEASGAFWAHYARAMSTESIRVDGWVVGFNVAIAIVTGLLFGLLPALQASKSDLNQALKNVTGGWSRGFGGLRGLNSRSVLIVAEMALAVVLLAGAGLMIESFARHFLVAIDAWQESGFQTVARAYLPRLAAGKGLRRDIADNGDLNVRPVTGKAERKQLVPALASPSWLSSLAPRPA